MRTESELRDELRRTRPGTTSRIDPDAVIRKAKARRAPRQIAFGSVAVLAVAGFAILGTSTLPSFISMSTGTADSAGVAGPESAMSELKDDHFNGLYDARRALTGRCGETSSALAPTPLGLQLMAAFPSSIPADGESVAGTVTLTNTGSSHVRGSTSSEPVLILSRNGVTVWHSNGPLPSEPHAVDLAPGDSISYPASFTPVECSAEDEVGDRFRDNLPALEPGEVELTAAIWFVPEGADTAAGAAISGPPQTITLR